MGSAERGFVSLNADAHPAEAALHWITSRTVGRDDEYLELGKLTDAAKRGISGLAEFAGTMSVLGPLAKRHVFSAPPQKPPPLRSA